MLCAGLRAKAWMDLCISDLHSLDEKRSQIEHDQTHSLKYCIHNLTLQPTCAFIISIHFSLAASPRLILRSWSMQAADAHEQALRHELPNKQCMQVGNLRQKTGS